MTKPSPRPRARTLADQLRDAIVASTYSDTALAGAAGIDISSVGRFLRAERNWTLDTADRVAAVLGLELGQARAPRPRPPRQRRARRPAATSPQGDGPGRGDGVDGEGADRDCR